jgi:hypothetical protein
MNDIIANFPIEGKAIIYSCLLVIQRRLPE